MSPRNVAGRPGLRRRLGAAWRWPLYSRTRFIGSIAAVLIAILFLPGLLNRDPADPGQPDVETSTVSATTTPIPTPAPTGTGDPSDVTADPSNAGRTPNPGASPNDGAVDRRDPAAVAAAWLTEWCTQLPSEPVDGNLSRAATWMTPTARRQAEADLPTAESWARTQAAGLATTCASVTATLMDGASPTPDARNVVVSATRQITNPSGQLLSTQPYLETRRLTLDSDGRWLVDGEVTAG